MIGQTRSTGRYNVEQRSILPIIVNESLNVIISISNLRRFDNFTTNTTYRKDNMLLFIYNPKKQIRGKITIIDLFDRKCNFVFLDLARSMFEKQKRMNE